MNKQVDEGMPIELRKQLLITQGAMYRSGIISSKDKVVAGLRADSLARSAIKQVGLAAFDAWRSRSGIAAVSLPAVVPMIIGGVSKLWQQPKLKPVIRGVAIAGAVASAFALFVRWRKAKTADDEEPDSEVAE